MSSSSRAGMDDIMEKEKPNNWKPAGRRQDIYKLALVQIIAHYNRGEDAATLESIAEDALEAGRRGMTIAEYKEWAL